MDHDIPEGILNFQFDHIYACHTENEVVSNDNLLHNIENEKAQKEIMQLTLKLNDSQIENCRLKDLIIINLDLIQQQSEELIQKEKEIALYQQEIEKLKLSNTENGQLNLCLQNLNPPPLIHLTGQTVPTVTILPENSQVQFANITSIINTNSGVENIITQKSFEKKQDASSSYADGLPCTNVGSLIDTRFIQCAENVFEPQSSISIQDIVQSMVQSPVQPIIQTTVHTSNQSTIKPIVKTATVNKIHFKTVPLHNNKISLTKHTPNLIKQFEDDKQPKISGHIMSHDLGSKSSDNNLLVVNKKCKTIHTYEKSSKKFVKKNIKTINRSSNFLSLSNKIQKNKNVIKSYGSIGTSDKLYDNFTISNSSIISESLHTSKYNSFLKSDLSPKSENDYTDEIVSDKVSAIKTIKTEKPIQPRKFFTSGISLKEKSSCRDFSYGESLENIKYGVKSDMLEYLEGNNSNSQSEIDVLDTNLEDDKEDPYSIPNMSPRSDSPEPINIEKEIGIQHRLGGTLVIPHDIMNKFLASRNSYSLPNHEEFFNNVNEIFMDRYLEIQEEQRQSLGVVSPQSSESHRNSIQSKSNPSKKRNLKRKTSTLSQGDPAMPYSWSFSGQDFKTLLCDGDSKYYTPAFGSNESYFSSTQLAPKESIDEEVNLEVPSWRIKTFPPDEHIHTTEIIDEELYLKRHSKMEAEEKRIKRWDFQMIREQRHIEKLKQRQERRNSGGFKHGRNSKVVCTNVTEELPSSFYPPPDDILALEVSWAVPISAFGECIPDLPSRYFQLPWIRSSSLNHSRNHASVRKKPRLYKSDEE